MIPKLSDRSEADTAHQSPLRATIFERKVARIDDPGFFEGHAPGHVARRLIGGREPAFTDPFLVLEEDWMPRGTFEIHPHRGIETVTLVLEGTVEHHDSVGNRGLIHAGDAQWMTVGRGVRHREDPPERTSAHVLQLWLNLPASDKMTDPRYQVLRETAMPVRKEPGVEARVFSGRSGKVVSSTLNHVPVTIVDVRLEAGFSLNQDLPAADNAFIYVIEGVVRVGAESSFVKRGQLAWLTRTQEEDRSYVLITATELPARVLILSGRPLREPVVFGGPFVMNTKEQIQEAFDDYHAGRL